MFKKVPIKYPKISASARVLKYGVGVNDADYVIKTKEGCCPVYTCWDNMLRRCYYKSSKWPTYSDTVVCKEWLVFSAFSAWMVTQDWQGKQLDKDIIKPSNTLYCPDLCVFITQDVNKLLTNHAAKRGKCLEGVYFHKKTGKYRAQINVSKVRKYLGHFSSEIAAHASYVSAKAAYIRFVAEKQTDERVKAGLLAHAILYEIKSEVNNET